MGFWDWLLGSEGREERFRFRDSNLELKVIDDIRETDRRKRLRTYVAGEGEEDGDIKATRLERNIRGTLRNSTVFTTTIPEIFEEEKEHGVSLEGWNKGIIHPEIEKTAYAKMITNLEAVISEIDETKSTIRRVSDRDEKIYQLHRKMCEIFNTLKDIAPYSSTRDITLRKTYEALYKVFGNREETRMYNGYVAAFLQRRIGDTWDTDNIPLLEGQVRDKVKSFFDYLEGHIGAGVDIHTMRRRISMFCEEIERCEEPALKALYHYSKALHDLYGYTGENYERFSAEFGQTINKIKKYKGTN